MNTKKARNFNEFSNTHDFETIKDHVIDLT